MNTRLIAQPMPDSHDARRFLTLEKPLRFRRRGALIQPILAYESWGQLNAAKSNAVVVFTGLSPGAHACASATDPVPGWWEFMIGAGKPIDTDRFYVLCFNSLGSCKGSTGPASINPETGREYRLDFPELSLQDIANATYLALQQMGINHLQAVVGPSMGGMTALAFLLEHPGVSQNLVSISSAAHAEPFSIAIRSLQREAIRHDPDWKNGQYSDDAHPVFGMRLARKIGLLSYRSAVEWKHRFHRHRIPEARRESRRFAAEFEIESYLEAHADRFIGQFDPACYLYLSQAMDWFDAGDYADDAAIALAGMKLDSALVIGVDSDILFPLHQQQFIADALARGGTQVHFHDLPSIQGHDSFLVDMENFTPPVRVYFESLFDAPNR